MLLSLVYLVLRRVSRAGPALDARRYSAGGVTHEGAALLTDISFINPTGGGCRT
jgi:hypothetical protein